MTPGLLIAAPRSGSGKTTVTLGLLRALKRRGLGVSPVKCGPDYIDPAFHTVAAGRPSRNLDSWAMSGALIDSLLKAAGTDADLVLGEGAMGLFDGVATTGATGDGSSADIAERAGWPVVLVLDVSGHSQSAGAVAKGFANFRAGTRLASVILNKVASERHQRLATRGVEAAGIPILGALPRRADAVIPERHLGLVQAEEIAGLETLLERLADEVEAHIDIDTMLASATATPLAASVRFALKPPGQRIALARDAAFSFVYPHILEGWLAAGAAILPFSPLADEGPDPSADVCWLPGGYPELHAGRLAANAGFLGGLRAFATTKPVHGECGGYMVLGAGLVDASGERHAMAGLLRVETSFATRKMTLGYRSATALAASPVGAAGTHLRGHEFHYATILAALDEPLFAVRDADGKDCGMAGGKCGNVTASFFHVIQG